MLTPFDAVIEEIGCRRYHNQRQEEHSDRLSFGILEDLRANCEPLRRDLENGTVSSWINVPVPGPRPHKIDLLVGETVPRTTDPDLRRIRVCIEHKSVITAHRNKTNRFGDLNEILESLYRFKPEGVFVATVLIGVAPRFLNVADRVRPFFHGREADFERLVATRLSSGDPLLWDDYPHAVSINRPNDPAGTAALFRTLRTRPPGHSHVVGYDSVLLVPVHIDNVNPPRVERGNDLGIDVDADYRAMLEQVCRAYRARWHV